MLGMWRRTHAKRLHAHRHPNNKGFYNIQEATGVDDMAKNIPKIHATLDNK